MAFNHELQHEETKTEKHTFAGVECITFDKEADEELVSLLHKRPGAYAIVSGDSDFFVMDGARCIPFEYLDILHENHEAAGDICVRVFTPEVRGIWRWAAAVRFIQDNGCIHISIQYKITHFPFSISNHAHSYSHACTMSHAH